MRLTDLDPVFVRLERRVDTYQVHKPDGYESQPGHVHCGACWMSVTGPRDYHHEAASLAEAQGVEFDDPVGHAKGENSFRVLVWFRDRGVPDDASPSPGRWSVSGGNLADLTLTPSVDLTMGGQKPGLWHGFVTDGEIR